MAVALEILEWFDPTGEIMVHRIPESGSTDIKMGAQLIVRENQRAIFFRDGKALDEFGPGRHTLTTMNIPILTRLLSLPFGFNSPFRAEVYFISQQAFLNQKWGTSSPVVFRDSELDMIRLRAHGMYSMRIKEAKLFLNKVVGTVGDYHQERLRDYFREIIVGRFNDILGEVVKTIFDLPKYYDELAAGLKARVNDMFDKIGLELLDVVVAAITPPEEVQKLIDQRAGMGAVGNMNKFMQFKAAQAMEKMAESGGGTGEGAGAGMGLGMGAGFGMMMPQMLNQAMQGQQTGGGAAGNAATSAARPTITCSQCQKPVPVSSKFCPECGNKMAPAAICPECKAEIPLGAKFCPQCGKSVVAEVLTCPKCSQENEPGSKFCSNCGQKLES